MLLPSPIRIAGDLPDLGEGLDGADLVAGVYYRDQHGPGPNGSGDVGGFHESVGTSRDDGHLEALPSEVMAVGEDGFVLERGGDDVVACAADGMGDTGDGKVVGFGGAGGKDDLSVSAGADQVAELPSGNAHRVSGDAPVGVRARRVAVMVGQVGQHRLKHTRGVYHGWAGWGSTDGPADPGRERRDVTYSRYVVFPRV